MVRGQSNGGGASQLNFLFGGEEQVLKERNAPSMSNASASMKPTAGQLDVETERQIRGMSLPDLRVALRARGLSPAGGLEALRERLVDCIKSGGSAQVEDESEASIGRHNNNNYARPDGQNVGNFITDRPSSRVLKAPGGGSQIIFG